MLIVRERERKRKSRRYRGHHDYHTEKVELLINAGREPEIFLIILND